MIGCIYLLRDEAVKVHRDGGSLFSIFQNYDISISELFCPFTYRRHLQSSCHKVLLSRTLDSRSMPQIELLLLKFQIILTKNCHNEIVIGSFERKFHYTPIDIP